MGPTASDQPALELSFDEDPDGGQVELRGLLVYVVPADWRLDRAYVQRAIVEILQRPGPNEPLADTGD